MGLCVSLYLHITNITDCWCLWSTLNNRICQCLRWLAWLALALPYVGRCPLCCSWPSPEDRRDPVSWQVATLILFRKIWVDSSLQPVGGVALRVQAGLCGRCVKVQNSVHSHDHHVGCPKALLQPCVTYQMQQWVMINLNTTTEEIVTPTIRNSQEQVCKLSCWLL